MKPLFLLHDGTLGKKMPAHVGWLQYATRGPVPGVMISGFPSAMRCHSREDAEVCLKFWNEIVAQAPEHAERIVPALINMDTWRPLLEDPLFKDCHPLDQAHIPEAGMVIEIRYRNGTKLGSSGDYIRKELLRGRQMDDPRIARWRELPCPPDHYKFEFLDGSGATYLKK